jgi:hypothetical protein
MAYAYPGDGALDYYPVRYGTSRVVFRGPRPRLDQPYCVALGGTETYGRFVARPFPALVETELGHPVVNLGCGNAGPDVFLQDPAVLEVAQGALVVVLQVLGAANLSNRFYSVHPRRNDRFLRASPRLQALYPEVDFTEFAFTRHLLTVLERVDPERFTMVRAELQTAWAARMSDLLRQLARPVLLLWLSGQQPPPAEAASLRHTPVLVDAGMIATLRPLACDFLAVVPSAAALAVGVEGMAFASPDRAAALELPGPLVHREIAQALTPRLHRLVRQ